MILTKNILHLLNRSSKVHKIDILVYLKINLSEWINWNRYLLQNNLFKSLKFPTPAIAK